MLNIIFATNNKGKLAQIREILKSYDVTVYSLNEVGIKSDVEETGSSYEENAMLKAKDVAEKSVAVINQNQRTNYIVMADDSGLEVEALNGEPGIYSARYAEGSDKDRINKLLKVMANVPQEKRAAKFVSTIVGIKLESGEVLKSIGEWNGVITTMAIGENGFGYEPVFYDQENKMTAAEMSLEEITKVNHRAKALHNMMQKLNYNQR